MAVRPTLSGQIKEAQQIAKAYAKIKAPEKSTARNIIPVLRETGEAHLRGPNR